MNHAKTQYFVTLEKGEEYLYDYSDVQNFIDYISLAEKIFSPLTLQKMIEVDLGVETKDIDWDTFTKNHIRDLQHFVETYSVIGMPQGFDSPTTEANRVIGFRDSLEEYLSCLQSFDELDDTLGNKIVDFDKGYMSTYKKISNESVERDIEIRSLCESIRNDEQLPRAEKYDKIEKLVQYYYYHASAFTKEQIKRLQALNIDKRRDKLSSGKKIILLAGITTLLLLSQPRQNNEQGVYTTPTTPEQLFENTENNEMIKDYIGDQLAQNEERNMQDDKNKGGSQDQKITSKNNEEANNLNAISKKLKTTQAISDTMNVQAPSLGEKVVNAVREVFTAPAPLEIKKVNNLSSISTVNHRELMMKKEKIGKFFIYKDAIEPVYFWKVNLKPGQSLWDVHNELKKDERFSYLSHKSYAPSDGGNVTGWNIEADKLIPGDLVPIPLNRNETVYTKEEFKIHANDGLLNIIQNEIYGEFVQKIQSELGAEYLVKLMTAFASKESDLGKTSMFRDENHIRAKSYSWFHILDSGPGRKALKTLGYTPADVMYDPVKASEWFWAYRFEKFETLKYNKNFGKYMKTPRKFFKKSNIVTMGRIYNGSEKYGVALKDRID